MSANPFLRIALTITVSIFVPGARAGDPAWRQLTFSGIQIDANVDAWHAGRVDDVIAQEPGAGIVVATDSGGVWSISDNGGAIPLSDDWDRPRLNCLARGSDGLRHYFAAGDGIYETDTTKAFPLFNWREVPGPNWITQILRMTVVPAQRHLFIVGQNGVAWSVLPAAGAPASAYSWNQVPTLSTGPYSGVVLGPDGSLVVAAWGANLSNGRYGIFRGTWNGTQWVFSRSSISGLTQTAMNRTYLAVCDGNPNHMYALTADNTGIAGLILGVLRSTDGGRTWAATAQRLEGQPGKTLHDVGGDRLNSRYGTIGVSPTDPNRVVVGCIGGPYLSTDAGENWHAAPPAGKDHRHEDMTSIYFDPADATGQRFYLTSDGGVIMSPDFGDTWISHYNRSLANLEFLGPTGQRQWYGTLGASSAFNPQTGRFDSLIGGGLQDNGNVYLIANQGPTPWRKLQGGDGGLMFFLQNRVDLLNDYRGDGNDGFTRRNRWDGPSQTFVDHAHVPVRPPPASGNNGLDRPAFGLVENPNWRNDAGQLMYAIGGPVTGAAVFGLFGHNDFSDLHWESLASVPLTAGQLISAVASYDGTAIYVGTWGGRLFRITSATRSVAEVNLPLPAWYNSANGNNHKIHHLATPSASAAFATFNYVFPPAHGTVYRTFDGTTWGQANNGLPDTIFYAMIVDTVATPRACYLASDDRVYVSTSSGDSWSDFSAGLPRRAHSSDLRVLADDSDNSRWLYLSTYGRSVWRTQLVGPHQVLYVNRNYDGTTENGTLANPYKTVTRARDEALPGATIRIFRGNYNETPPISKTLTLEAYTSPVTIGRP